MRKLEFVGKVRSNKGRFHQDMVVPGHTTLTSAPIDWPVQLAPGTLNVGVDDDGFPDDFGKLGESNGVRKFDEGKFLPAFTIAADEIIGNTLKARRNQPNRGTGQVWRAVFCNLSTGKSVDCWMLRRIGSSISAQIELVSEENLRKCINLYDDTPVRVTVFEG